MTLAFDVTLVLLSVRIVVRACAVLSGYLRRPVMDDLGTALVLDRFVFSYRKLLAVSQQLRPRCVE